MNRTYVFKKAWKRSLARAVDAAGSLAKPAAAPTPTAINRLLLTRLDHLGDVVCLLPLLDALAALSPKPHVTVLTSEAGSVLLRDTQGVEERLVFNASWFGRRKGPGIPEGILPLLRTLRERNFDASLELTGDARHHMILALAGVPFRAGYGTTGGAFLLHREMPWDRSRHAADRNMDFLRLLGWEPPAGAVPRLLWRPRPEEVTWLAGVPGGRRMILHVDAGTPAKRWPPERFGALMERARDAGFAPLLVGQDATLSKPLAPFLRKTGGTDLVGKTTLSQLVTLIQSSEAVVSADSGPAHIAAALEKPTFVLWSGTGDPQVWRPRGGSVRLVESKVPCSYCEMIHCPLPVHACMEELTLPRVLPAFDRFLGDLGPTPRTIEVQTPPVLSIVIVSYNDWEHLATCLESLRKNPFSASQEVIVVDNDSSDGTAEKARRLFPEVSLVENAANIGFSKACNMGATLSHGRYVLFLNGDAQALPGSLDRLVGWMDSHPRTGAAGPELVGPGGRIIQMSWGWDPVLSGELLMKPLAPEKVQGSGWRRRLVEILQREARRVPYICGASLISRREVFDKLGGFDEEFELYFEDADFCARVRRAGWDVDFVPESKVLHHWNQSAKKSQGLTRVIYRQSQLRYYRKHAPGWTVMLLRLFLLSKSLTTARAVRRAFFRVLTGRKMFLRDGLPS